MDNANNKPVMLVILDGFGLADASDSNAVSLAHTPNFDRYSQEYPHSTLQASGEAVGLPEGQMGNSEVGHMNLGAGRVVLQSLSYIQRRIDDSSFFDNQVLNDIYGSSHALHLMGLVSRGGVHSDLPHLFALLELAKRRNVAPVYVHVFTDGRDTAPDSGRGYVQELQDFIDKLQHEVHIASVSGRYYAMDRDTRWDRVKRAYDAIVCGQAEYQASSALEAINNAYARGETDEFILPTVIPDAQGQPVRMHDDDGVVFFNFRADRARQLSYALLGDADWQAFPRCQHCSLHYASLMPYDKTLNRPYAFALPELTPCLAQVLSDAGKTQYHTAETEKYPHVTYFFNAKIETPLPGETQVMLPSPQVATYDLQPEMSAPELTERTVARIREHDDDFVLINYANPDMVGHTGVLEAAIAACEASDRGLGAIVEAMRAKGGRIIILADHGNAEQMRDPQGNPHTAHTTNPVPCVLISDQPRQLRSGVLGDVAPTVLELLGVAIPEAMTGTSLLQH